MGFRANHRRSTEVSRVRHNWLLSGSVALGLAALLELAGGQAWAAGSATVSAHTTYPDLSAEAASLGSRLARIRQQAALARSRLDQLRDDEIKTHEQGRSLASRLEVVLRRHEHALKRREEEARKLDELNEAHQTMQKAIAGKLVELAKRSAAPDVDRADRRHLSALASSIARQSDPIEKAKNEAERGLAVATLAFQRLDQALAETRDQAQTKKKTARKLAMTGAAVRIDVWRLGGLERRLSNRQAVILGLARSYRDAQRYAGFPVQVRTDTFAARPFESRRATLPPDTMLEARLEPEDFKGRLPLRSRPSRLSPADTMRLALARARSNLRLGQGGILPIIGELVTRFGERAEGVDQSGIVIAGHAGAPVKAPKPGRIVFADRLSGVGLLLIIDHGNEYHSVLSGLSRLDVGVADEVEAGDHIAALRHTTEGPPQLYVELRHGGRPINPLPWLTAATNEGRS